MKRRNFLNTSAAGLAGTFTLPTILTACGRGRNDIIQVAQIGCGRIARSHDLPETMKYDHARVVACADVDIKRAKDALKNDPFVKHHKEWQKAINQMLKAGVRVEQQAFAKHGLDYVVKNYLPEKFRKKKQFLP